MLAERLGRWSGRRGFRPTWPRDGVWTLTRLGSLGVDGRLREDVSERDPGPCRCQRSQPSSEDGTRLSRAPQGASARSASNQSGRHVVDAQAPERATQRYNSVLTALRATELSISCRGQGGFSALGRVSFVRWSHGAKIAAQQLLLGDCWPCATCCWVSCLAPMALRVLTVFLGKFCVLSLVHVAPGAISCVCSSAA